MVKLNELFLDSIPILEESQPSISGYSPEPQEPENPTDFPYPDPKEFFRIKRLEWLKSHAAHPLMKAQRDAIYIYARQPIALTRQLFSGGLHLTRGQRGFILDREALSILPRNACDKLKKGLALSQVELVGLQEYVYTLPTSYFRIVKG